MNTFYFAREGIDLWQSQSPAVFRSSHSPTTVSRDRNSPSPNCHSWQIQSSNCLIWQPQSSRCLEYQPQSPTVSSDNHSPPYVSRNSYIPTVSNSLPWFSQSPTVTHDYRGPNSRLLRLTQPWQSPIVFTVSPLYSIVLKLQQLFPKTPLVPNYLQWLLQSLSCPQSLTEFITVSYGTHSPLSVSHDSHSPHVSASTLIPLLSCPGSIFSPLRPPMQMCGS